MGFVGAAITQAPLQWPWEGIAAVRPRKRHKWERIGWWSLKLTPTVYVQTHIITQLIAVTGLLVRYCVQRASVLPNTPLSSMMKGSFVVAPRVLAKVQLAAGLRRGHRSRQAAQDCGVIHCAGLPPPLCGAVTSPLSRDESARARRRGAWELHKWCLSAAVLSPRPSVDGARR